MHTKAKRTGHAGEVIVVAALALAVAMILLLTTPISPAAAETGAPDTDDPLFHGFGEPDCTRYESG